MKKTDAINLFGTQEKIAMALGVKQSSVSNWGEEIPELRAYQVERLLDAAKETNTPLELIRIRPNGRISRRLPKGDTPKSIDRELKRAQCIQQDIERAHQEMTNGDLEADVNQDKKG